MSNQLLALSFHTHCLSNGIAWNQRNYDAWLDANPGKANLAPLCVDSLDADLRVAQTVNEVWNEFAERGEQLCPATLARIEIEAQGRLHFLATHGIRERVTLLEIEAKLSGALSPFVFESYIKCSCCDGKATGMIGERFVCDACQDKLAEEPRQ